MSKLSLQSWRFRPKNTIAVYPSVYTMAYATGEECLKMYGARLKSAIFVIGKNDIEILMESKADYQKFSALLVKKFKNQPEYLDNLIKWSKDKTDFLFDFINLNLNKDNIKKISNQELANRYLKYVQKYLAYHLKNTPSWWLGALVAEDELKKYLVLNYPNYSSDDLNNILGVIIDPLEYPSENFKEELSLLSIAVKSEKNKVKKFQKVSDLPETIRGLFYRHCLLYNSLPFGYNTGLVWRERDFLKRLKQMIKTNPVLLKRAKLQDIKIRKIKRDKVVFDLKLPKEIKNLVFALRKLAYLQELKKTAQTKSHPILQLIVKKEISARLKLEIKYLDYLSETEISLFLTNGFISPKIRKEIISRESFSVNIVRNLKSNWLIGREAKEFIKVNGLLLDVAQVNEIKGQVASPGLVRGRVKICVSSKEINKIKKGDILVTAMTTPDFVPAMRIAAAIITDEGGITSHAAIVARELHKPCIIGAKIATKVFHDDDLVEVDANFGVVRLVS